MIWAIRNWQLVLIMTLAFVLGLVGIRSASLSNRLAAAKARADELESYRNGRTDADEVDRTIGGDPAAAREFLRNRKP